MIKKLLFLWVLFLQFSPSFAVDVIINSDRIFLPDRYQYKKAIRTHQLWIQSFEPITRFENMVFHVGLGVAQSEVLPNQLAQNIRSFEFGFGYDWRFPASRQHQTYFRVLTRYHFRKVSDRQLIHVSGVYAKKRYNDHTEEGVSLGISMQLRGSDFNAEGLVLSINADSYLPEGTFGYGIGVGYAFE